MNDQAPTELEQLSEQLAQQYEETALVARLNQQMTVDGDADGFLNAALDAIAEVAVVRGAGIVTWDASRLGDPAVYTFGEPALTPGELDRLRSFLHNRLTTETGCEAAAEGAFFRTNDVAADPDLAWLAPRGRQLLAVPLRRGGSSAGALFVIDKDVPEAIFGTFNDGAFTSIDRKLLASVALQLAMFLENRRLFVDAERLMMGLLHALVAAVDAKDAYTRGHSVRVALFARRLAEAAGCEGDYCDRVYLSGLLHDVGKIGVDDAVIRKPGKLTDEEFAQIKRHPEIGYKILERVPKIEDVLPGVLSHHEKYNGRGYPHGLAGEDIPLLGRIMCVADSFDAMTSSRTYRSAMPLVKALQEVRDCAGTQFDPALAEAFCTIPEMEFQTLIAMEREGRPPLLRLAAPAENCAVAA